MDNIKKIISVLLVVALSACSSQKFVMKDLGYSIKDETEKIVYIKLVDGRSINLVSELNYSYELKDEFMIVKKYEQTIEMINYNNISEYSVENVTNFSVGNCLLGYPVGTIAAFTLLAVVAGIAKLFR